MNNPLARALKGRSSIRCAIGRVVLAALFFALCAKEISAHPGEMGPPASQFSAEVAVAWFKLQLELSQQTPGFSPPVVSRAFAYAGITLYEAIVPGVPTHQSLAGQLNGLTAMPQPAVRAEYHWPTVANSALAAITKRLFANAPPQDWAEIDFLEARFNQQFQARLQPEVFKRSVAQGKSVAEAIYLWSLDDGGHEGYRKNFSDSYTPPVGRGLWMPGGSSYSKTLQPFWGDNRPFVLSSGSDCAPPPHPAYSEQPGSAFYAEAMEVYTTGKNLTVEQRTIAKFWADNPGQTSTPPGHSLSILSQILQQKNATIDMAAEAYAKVGMALADAFIACWSAKYQYNLIRPITYINRIIDPSWKPLLLTPPFPEYPSGHSVQSGAFAQVMTDIFGAMAFVDHTNDNRGFAPRTFNSFFEAANEAAISRLYGGIHYRAAIEFGLSQGKCVGQKVSALQFKKPVISNQYSVISKQYSVISNQYSVISKQYPVISKQYPVISKQYPVSRIQDQASSIQDPASKQKRILLSAEFQIDLTQKSATVKPLTKTSARSAEKLAQPESRAAAAAVTNFIRLTTSNVRFDAQNKIFSFDVTLTNISQTRVFTPLQTIIENLRPGPPTITVVNADAGGNGIGALWDFSNHVGADAELAPNEASRTRNWKFFNPQLRQFSFTVRVEGELTGPNVPVPPTVVQPATPTRQRNIQVTGTTAPQADVEIVGGAATITTRANANGEFTTTVELMPNRVNRLFVTAINFVGRSASTPVEVINDTQPPSLYVDVPTDSAELTNNVITVIGRVSDLLTGFMGLGVTVNGLPADVIVGIGTNATYERQGISLTLGSNPITIVATDQAGNSVTKRITITRFDPTGQPLMAVVSGNNQTARVNTELPQPFVVKMVKPDGVTPFPNKIITFDVTRSDGRLSRTTPVLGDSLMVQARTNANGEARVYWKLGTDAGRGNNRVAVSSTSIAGTVMFCASATPNPANRINVGMGNNQRAEISSPAPESLRVWVNDGVNGIGNIPVTFTVTQGDGRVNGVNSVTVNSAITGHAEVSFTLGSEPGNNVIEANFPGNLSLPATFVIYGLAREAGAPTSFTGVVLDNANNPVDSAYCSLRVGGVNLPATFSDSTGYLSFTNIPSGPAQLYVDGSTARAVNGRRIPLGSFPFLVYDLVIVPNTENGLSTPVLLPPLNPNNARVYDGTKDVELTIEGIEGLKMIVKAGSMMRSDSTRPSPQDPAIISLNQVHFDKIPMAMPDGAAPPIAWTLQPALAIFDPPVQVILPNMSGLPPGATMYFLSFNHETHSFEIVSSGKVSADGQTMVTDPGSGISTAGWGGFCPPYPDPTETNNDDDKEPPKEEEPQACPSSNESCPKEGEETEDEEEKDEEPEIDPVYLFSGEFYQSAEDLRIKGRGLDFVWARKYRSKLRPNTSQGNGWDFSYNVFLQQEGDALNLCDGNTRNDLYLPNTDSTWARGEFFREFVKNPDGTYTQTFPDRGKWNFNAFDGSSAAGKLVSIVDRKGNQLTLHYNAQGRLEKITDTLDRDIMIGYDANGFIATITDFAGRIVKYEYYDENEAGGNFGDLKSATTPAVAGTPNNNDFPNGKITTYTYSTGFSNDQLNHNLLTITDGRRNDPNDPTFGSGPYLINIYGTPADSADINFDRIVRQIWGGDTVDVVYVPQTPSPSRGKATLKVIVNDRVGNVKEYFYDIRNRGILEREYTGRANPNQPTTETRNRPIGKLRSTDPDFFETRYEYNYDALRTRIIHPNGNITENIYEADLNPDASPRSRNNLRVMRHLPGSHTPVGDQAIIEERFEYDTDFGGCCGFNFVTKYVDGRGDSTLNEFDDEGNRIRTQHRITSIIEDFEYNEFGQITAHILPNNGSNHRRRDEYIYYDSGPQGGYLRQEIIDATNLALTTVYEYDRVGNVIRVIDPRGHDTQYVFNELDQVVREISREVQDGSVARYERDFYYDANNNVIRIDVQNIDDRGVLQSNTHFTTTLEYEILNYLIRTTEEVDPQNNIVTEYEYDRNRNRTLIRYGEATAGRQPTNVMRMLYDERDLAFREIRAAGDPKQSTTQYDYDRNGNLVTRRVGIENAPRIFSYVFDGYNRLVTMTDPMGNVTTNNYDANNNVVRSRHAGELIDIPGNTNNVRLSDTLYVYDAMDRQIRTEIEFFDTDTQIPIDNGKAVTQLFYSDNSQLTRLVDDNNHQILIAYDTANRQSVITDAKSNTTTYAYDANSNITSATELEKSDLGNPDETFVTTYVFDNLDRLIRHTDNVGNTNEFRYDSRNNRTLQLDALRSAPDSAGNRVTMAYDGLNRLIRTNRYLTSDGTGAGVVIDSIVTAQTWDHTSRVIAQADDNGNVTNYNYDALNRLTNINYADSTGYAVTYDVHDNPITMADANGNVVTGSYDLLNRSISRSIIRGPGVFGTTLEEFKYDGLSRLVLARDDDSEVTRSYNSLSMVTRETLNGKTTTSIHDGEGNTLSCAYPGGRRIVTSYDDLDRKELIVDQQGPIASYDYTGPVRVERRDYANNSRTTYQYDGVKRIIRTTHTFDPINIPVVFDDRSYSWDQMYNKISRSDLRPGGLTHNYEYDSVYRLLRSRKSRGGNPIDPIDYSFDSIGNRTAVIGGPNPGSYSMSSMIPEPADFQVNQYTRTSFDARTYDRNGNLLNIDSGLPGQRNFAYDYRNQLIEHREVASGALARYAYDAIGRRMEKTVNDGTNTVTTRYFYDMWQVVEEQDGNGTTQASYVYGLDIDEVLNMQRDVNLDGTLEDYYYHTDDLLNVMAVTNATQVVERYEYGDYGEPEFLDANGNPITEARSLIGNPYLFTGQRYDVEIGFYYYRSRYFDPISGRFTTRDVIGIWGDDGNVGGGFTYVGNNPWTNRDPYGLAAVAPAVAVEAAKVALVTAALAAACNALPKCKEYLNERARDLEKAYERTKEAIKDLAQAIKDKIAEARRTWRNRGKCGPIEYYFLKKAVDTICHEDPNKTACDKNDCPEVLEAKIAQRFACIAARQARETRCFQGGDPEHKDEIKNQKSGLATCLAQMVIARLQNRCGSP